MSTSWRPVQRAQGSRLLMAPLSSPLILSHGNVRWHSQCSWSALQAADGSAVVQSYPVSAVKHKQAAYCTLADDSILNWWSPTPKTACPRTRRNLAELCSATQEGYKSTTALQTYWLSLVRHTNLTWCLYFTGDLLLPSGNQLIQTVQVIINMQISLFPLLHRLPDDTLRHVRMHIEHCVRHVCQDRKAVGMEINVLTTLLSQIRWLLISGYLQGVLTFWCDKLNCSVRIKTKTTNPPKEMDLSNGRSVNHARLLTVWTYWAYIRW